MEKHIQLQSLLMDIQAHLAGMGRWDVEPPKEEAFASTAPFAVDTMEFYQWLQWIFIPTLRGMMEQGAVLPEQCGVAPMAEQWASMRALDAKGLIDTLNDIDKVLSGK